MARNAVQKRKTPSKKAAAKKKAPAKAPSSPKSKSVRVTAVAGKTITASALLQAVSEHLGIAKSEAKAFVDAYTEVVKAYTLKGAKVRIGDVGMLTVRARKARMGRNPQTGEPVRIKASKKVSFRQSALMKTVMLGGTHGAGDGRDD